MVLFSLNQIKNEFKKGCHIAAAVISVAVSAQGNSIRTTGQNSGLVMTLHGLRLGFTDNFDWADQQPQSFTKDLCMHGTG